MNDLRFFQAGWNYHDGMSLHQAYFAVNGLDSYSLSIWGAFPSISGAINGAIYGAFSRAFNDELPHAIKNGFKSYFNPYKPRDYDKQIFDKILDHELFPNEFLVGGHGNKSGTKIFNELGIDRVWYDATALSIDLQNNPNYVTGTPIRLITCNSGACIGLAQELSTLMNVKVTGPRTNLQGTYTDGKLNLTHENDGWWQSYGN
jgi:hypothetical protein